MLARANSNTHKLDLFTRDLKNSKIHCVVLQKTGFLATQASVLASWLLHIACNNCVNCKCSVHHCV